MDASGLAPRWPASAFLGLVLLCWLASGVASTMLSRHAGARHSASQTNHLTREPRANITPDHLEGNLEACAEEIKRTDSKLCVECAIMFPDRGIDALVTPQEMSPCRFWT